MKKSVFILVCAFVCVSVFATPPHPGNTRPRGREIQDTERSAPPFYKSTQGPVPGMARAPFFAQMRTMNVLVLLVEFEDRGLDAKSTVTFYKELLETGPGLTMTQYYKNMSQGNLILNIHVEKLSSRLARGLAWYGDNDGAGNDRRPRELVREALNKLKLEKNDNSSYFQKFGNGDNYADAVFIIHPGPGEEMSRNESHIWSHQWRLRGQREGVVTAGGVIFDVYTIEPEYNSTAGDSTIGVFCHEFGHVLELPDLYDTTFETSGVGPWSLMGNGNWGSGSGKDPAPLLAWERYAVGGSAWVTLTTLSSSAVDVPIDDIDTSSPAAYKIDLGRPGQYLILEGKKQAIISDPEAGNIKSYVPGTGILVTQVHEQILNRKMGSNQVVAGIKNVHGITVIEANTPHDERGRGLLWAGNYRFILEVYGNMLFSGQTRGTLAPGYPLAAAVPFSPAGGGIFAAALLVFAAALLFFPAKKTRKKLRAAAAFLALSAAIFACSMDVDEESYPLVSHPNSNYYLSGSAESKTGISGVTVSDISDTPDFPMSFNLTIER